MALTGSVLTQRQSWSEIARRVRRVLPHLWPWRSVRLQALAMLCMVFVLAGRFVNVGIPFSLGQVVANLEAWKTGGASFWPPLLLYVGLRWAASALGTLEEMLWQPIMQYSDREMAQLSFDHILNLSLAYHTHRKTGEVLRILDRGSAINHVFELVLFSIVPTVLDIIIGLAVFWITYDATLSLVVAAVFVAYITASISLTTTRTKLRRRMNEADITTRGIHTDCLLNYETVKYFGNEQHEQQRYREAVLKYQSLEYKVIAYLNLLNIVQNTIISIGLLVGSVIVALRIVKDKESATGFIVFVTYLAQLYGPLNNLGYIYRSLNQSLVDTEKLLKLLDEPVDVQDKPGAPHLVVTDGEIEFENVSFSYGGNSQALNGVSFKIAKGQSVALVGQTGSGKSTALRLLYRFYDLADGQGRILIDGQDIRNVTQSSLRKAIGVVPQDSILFNSTIEYNIRYGKLDADFEEVVAASRAAQMHDRILTFQDGYQTTVGERGVRLSGGEKQRVAIARTLLKNPPVLLLDEATSALDTNTERDIQNALQNLMRGRSSLSIAHRLSTIAAADLILVLKDGQIIEQGNIRELIAKNGSFASMWAEQVKTDEDAQLFASFSGDIKQEYAESVRAPPSIRASVNSEGYMLDETVPEEAAALAGNLPSAAVEADATDAMLEPETYRTESPLPMQSSQDQDRTIESGLPATSEYAVSVAETKPEQDAPASVPVPIAPESSAKWDDSAPFAASPPAGATPMSFPANDDASVRRSASIANSLRPSAHGPNISFGPELDREPSRQSGTPDEEAKPKRTAAQNLQNLSKFAKRISLGRRVSTALSSSSQVTTPPAVSTPPSESPQASTPTRNPSDPPMSSSPVPSATPNEEAPSTVRSSMFRRKDSMAVKDDKPPAKRRTTLSFSRPKAPKPEGSQP
ncbi:hypothetical protein BKA62DRAFT_609850 [Auriculariales sp. MPI-PUGE-AT-0066]|nr:hypothetical protein BKA62DRAFT_609850 [Auriculariales sp. MPI-PUGE-AT-0066]